VLQFAQSVSKRKLNLITAFLILSGCGGGSSQNTSPSTAANSPTPLVSQPTVDIFPAQTNNTPLAAGGCGINQTSNNGQFTDVTAAAGLCYTVNSSASDSTASRVGGGIAVNDINADNNLDIYVTHGRDSTGKLFQLNNQFVFEDITATSGLNVTSTNYAASFIDLDADGDQDLISIQDENPFIQFFANQGQNQYTDISHLIDITFSKVAYSMAAGDVDLDGDLDLFFAHWDPDNKQNRWEYLWQQDGPGVYQDISQNLELEAFDAGIEAADDDEYSFTPIFADINNDRFPDLLVAADWGTSQYLVNNAGSNFVDDTIPAVISDRAGMGAAVADYDNDGDLDWFVSAIGDVREEFLKIGLLNGNRLYRNDGQGNFLNMTDYAQVRQGYWAWGSCFADINNDGYEDLFIVNGYNGWNEEQQQSGNFEKYSATRALLYVNQQDGRFKEQSTDLGVEHTGMGRGLVCYDYDRDGDIDLLIANNGASPTLLRNDSETSTQHFLNVRLKGLIDNPQAVGARIYLNTVNTNQMRELQLGSHFVSQNPVEAHFGMTADDTIEELRIKWPGTNTEDTVLNNVTLDRFMVIHHPDRTN
jgi:hypothetical protein